MRARVGQKAADEAAVEEDGGSVLDSQPSASPTPSPALSHVQHTQRHHSPRAASPWDFAAHLRTLIPRDRPFSSAFLPILSSPSVPSLDGLRALLSVCMMVYHAQSFLIPHVPASFADALFRHWAVYYVALGPVIVDWFFVLTGYLTALPLLLQEQQAVHGIRDSTRVDADSSTPLLPFSLSGFYHRRLSRILPCWLLTYTVHHLLLNPSISMTHSSIRNEGYQHIFSTVPDEMRTPHGMASMCSQPAFLPIQFSLLMQWLPFGGCQGATWSMGVQAQFWLWFPVLWRHLLRQTTRAGVRAGTQLLPSQRVVRWMWGVVVVWCVFRALAFFHTCRAPLATIDGVVLFFFWYANTATRMGTIAAGVLLAYYSTHTPSLPHLLRSNPALRYTFLTLHLLVLALIRFTTAVPQEGPALTLYLLTQLRLPMLVKSQQTFPPSAEQLLNMPQYAASLLLQTMFHVGSPGMALLICAVLVMLVHRVSGLWVEVAKVLEWKGWQPVATLSYLAFLIHPSLQQTFFLLYTDHVDPHWVPTVPLYLTMTAALMAATLLLAALVHVLYDCPVQAWLVGWKEGEVWAWRYALVCLIMSALVHGVGLPVMLLGYEPKHDAMIHQDRMADMFHKEL